MVRLFRSNCPRGVQKRISLEAAILCSKSKARFSDTARERWVKTSFILGSLSVRFHHQNFRLLHVYFCVLLQPNLSFSSFWWVPVTDLASNDQLTEVRHLFYSIIRNPKLETTVACVQPPLTSIFFFEVRGGCTQAKQQELIHLQ